MSHNLPGFPGGISGNELLRKMQDQAESFGANYCRENVASVEARGDHFLVSTYNFSLVARSILLATGVVNHRPPIGDKEHSKALQRGLLRYCPVCDAFEAKDTKIGVIGCDAHGASEALFLRRYSNHVTLLALHEPKISLKDRADLEEAGVTIVMSPIASIQFGQRAVAIVTSPPTSEILMFDTIYPALGSEAKSPIAAKLGSATGDDGCLLVDAHQRTTVAGVYAAGDVVLSLDQISVAMGQAAIAATAIHNDLRERGHQAPALG